MISLLQTSAALSQEIIPESSTKVINKSEINHKESRIKDLSDKLIIRNHENFIGIFVIHLRKNN